MFQNLRSGSPFYLLYKNDPRLVVAEVKEVSLPVPQFGITYQSGLMSQPRNTVDIKVSIDGEDMTLQKIPADLSIADFGSGMVVSDDGDAISNEISALMKNSEKSLSERPKHEHIVAECKKMLGVLNPHLAKETEQEKRIEQLTNEFSEMKIRFDKLTEILERGSKTEE